MFCEVFMSKQEYLQLLSPQTPKSPLLSETQEQWLYGLSLLSVRLSVNAASVVVDRAGLLQVGNRNDGMIVRVYLTQVKVGVGTG